MGPARGGGSDKAAKADSAPPAGPGGGFEVSISAEAGQVQQAKEALANLPDVRMEMVSALQSEIDSGQYQRDSHQVAKRMVNEHLRSSIKSKRR
jgi:flagellar biosynthesis anti-sigma factor FlgM